LENHEIKHPSINFLRLSYGFIARHLPSKNRKIWARSPSRRLARNTIFLRLYRSVVGL